jgi:hypothetical protein
MQSPPDRSAVKKMFQGDPDFARLVYQFNVYPAVYAHPEWFSDFLPDHLLGCFRKTRRGMRRLSGLLLKAHGMEGETWYDFSQPWWRFALLPPGIIDTLAMYGGLALAHRRIATMVDKAALTRLKGSIGERAYRFAVKRASLIVGRPRQIDMDGLGQEDLGFHFRRLGTTRFLSQFKNAPTVIAARLAFKFSPDMSCASVSQVTDEADRSLFKRILIHEIDSKWQRLFF